MVCLLQQEERGVLGSADLILIDEYKRISLAHAVHGIQVAADAAAAAGRPRSEFTTQAEHKALCRRLRHKTSNGPAAIVNWSHNL